MQGYMVGNGCTDEEFDGNAQVPFAVGKSLISTTLYKRVEAACEGNYYDVDSGSRCGVLTGWLCGWLAGLLACWLAGWPPDVAVRRQEGIPRPMPCVPVWLLGFAVLLGIHARPA